MTRSFRISEISNPEFYGTINQFVKVTVHYEYNPGDPYPNINDKMVIRLSEAKYLAIANPPPENINNALSRLAWFSVNKLSDFLSAVDPKHNEVLEITDREKESMLEIDPQKIPYITTDWIPLPDSIHTDKNIIFISCGQRSEEEKELGDEISRLVEELTDFEPYFAEYQHTLIGLTENIFNALHVSNAFIAVMHRREKISEKEERYRGSVWIEQEIALAAFMTQTLGIILPSKAYIEKGILQEGVRGYIHLNPMPFEVNEQILEDLRSWLPTLKKY